MCVCIMLKCAPSVKCKKSNKQTLLRSISFAVISSASAAQALRVLRLPSNWCSARPSIIGRGNDFYMRYGDKEREAVASFDFLDDIPIQMSRNNSSNSSINNSSDEQDDDHHHNLNNTSNNNNGLLDFPIFDSSPTLAGGRFNTERMKISPL